MTGTYWAWGVKVPNYRLDDKCAEFRSQGYIIEAVHRYSTYCIVYIYEAPR